MSKSKIIKFHDDLQIYKKLLLDSRDSVGNIVSSQREIDKARYQLIRKYASIENEIKQFSQGPLVADPVWKKYQDAYSVALSSDILIRVGPAIDAALDDLNYVIAKSDSSPKTSPEKSKDSISITLDSLHPKILKYCSAKYNDGHYPDAILTAYKVVLNEIKEITGIKNKDGKKLVEQALSLSKPLIKLNPLSTQSDQDEQQGFMLLFSGAALGIRNPKAHDLIAQDDPKRTLQLLSFASLLMDRLDEREK